MVKKSELVCIYLWLRVHMFPVISLRRVRRRLHIFPRVITYTVPCCPISLAPKLTHGRDQFIDTYAHLDFIET
jgi:hypothetical protein